MNSRRLAAPLAALLLGLGSCTAKYQDLLRDRDAQVRELNADLAELRATNADLERREREAREASEQLRSQLVARPETSDAELQRVKDDLDGLDVRYNRGRISIGIENTVTFASGSTKLKPEASAILNKVAAVLKRDFPNRRIYVEGHTDTDPIRRTAKLFRSNRHLSAERADVVADHLVRAGGIDPAQVVVVGFGPYDPRDPGTGDAAKTRNRRVEIVVGDVL